MGPLVRWLATKLAPAAGRAVSGAARQAPKAAPRVAPKTAPAAARVAPRPAAPVAAPRPVSVAPKINIPKINQYVATAAPAVKAVAPKLVLPTVAVGIGATGGADKLSTTITKQADKNKYTKGANDALVKPVLKSLTRVGKAATGRSEYDKGVKGVGQATVDAVNILGLTTGVGMAKNITKEGIKKGAAKGAKAAAPLGAAAGAGSALEQGRPEDAAQQAAIGGVTAAGVGGILGAAGGALGRVLGRTEKGVTVKVQPSKTPTPKPPKGAPLETTAPKAKAPKVKIGIGREEGRLQRAFSSISNRLGRMGKSGQALKEGLSAARNRSELLAADITGRMPTVLSLSRSEHKIFANVLENLSKGGKLVIDNPKIAQAVEEWRTTLPLIRDAAVRAGLDVGDLGEYYYPKNYDKVFDSSKKLQRAADNMVKNGQAKDLNEARYILNRARDTIRGRKFGHLEAHRFLDLPEYEMSGKAIGEYIQGSAERIAKAETFGANDERALKILDNVAKEGHDYNAAKDMYDIAVGNRIYSHGAEKLSSGLRTAQAVMKLGTAAVANATQLINTASVVGPGNVAKAIILKKQYDQWAKASGVNTPALMQRVMDQAGFGRGIVGQVAAPFFPQVEGFNRDVAAIAGKMWAEKLASKGKHDVLLRKLGIQAKGELTPEQATEAGRKIVELTQFKVDAQDLPAWAASPGGKLVAQFRTFVYKQSEFVYNELVKEAVQRGNVKPLATFIALAVPLGNVSGGVRDYINGRDVAFDPLKGVSNVGGFGFGSSAQFLTETAGSKNWPAYLAGTLAGPTAGTAVEAGLNINEGLKGDWSKLGKQVVKSVPIAGRPIAGRMGGSYNPREGEVNPKLLELVKKHTGKDYYAGNDTEAVETGDYLTNEEQAFAALKRANPKAAEAYANKPGNEYLKKIDDKKRAATQIVKGVNPNLPEGISEESTTAIKDYERLTTKGKKKFKQNGDNEMRLEVAYYERDLLSGKIETETDKYERQLKLAKLDIQKDYDHETRDLYAKSKTAIVDILEKLPNADDTYKRLVEMDRRLYEAGLVSTLKFKYGLGTKSGSSRSGSTRKGGRVKLSKAPKQPKAPKPKVSTSVKKARVLRASASTLKAPKLRIAKPAPRSSKSKIRFTA